MMDHLKMVINGENLMTTDIEEVVSLTSQEEIDVLLTNIRAVDKDASIVQLEHMKNIVMQHEDLFAHIITPATIKLLHDEIINNFGINRRYLQLRRRIDNKRKTAEMFLQAMINGVTSYNAA